MKVEPTSERVSGHTLWFEGAPHDSRGARMRYWGPGRGKCSCGALSDPLMTDNARKRWHREHKGEVLATRIKEGRTR